MKIKRVYIGFVMKYLCVVLLLVSSTFSFAEKNIEKTSGMLKTLSEWQKGGPQSSRVLRVIYFTPKDKEPAKNFQKRWDGILLDFEKFFSVQMARAGFGNKTIALEKEGEHVKLHIVKGKSNDDGTYSYKTGGLIRKEVRDAMAARGINIDQETVLIVNNLSKTSPGKVEIYSPFYGQGANHKYGICHVMDCEFLSIEGLRDTKTKLQVKEHGGFRPFTMAKFNTTYIGGAIHELGHGLSLPHNKATSEEKHLGTALMGAGNYTYRQEWRNEGKGSFLTFAHALRLATHPLFSGSQKEMKIDAKGQYSDLKIDLEDKKIILSGMIKSNVPVCGIIAYNDAKGKSAFYQVNNDYDATTWISRVNAKGEFKISIADLKKDEFQIRLVAVFNNGATSTQKFHYKSTEKFNPDLSLAKKEIELYERNSFLKPVLMAYASGNKEQASKMAQDLLKGKVSDQLSSRLKYLIEASKKKKTQSKSLATVPAETKQVFLSDYKWDQAKVGWRRPLANMYRTENSKDTKLFLEIEGKFFSKGFYAHSPSVYTYNLNGKWNEFSTSFGFRDGASNTARFIIKGDGKVLFDSGVAVTNKVYSKSVSVKGVNKLELVVESIKSNGGCWTIWVNPILKR